MKRLHLVPTLAAMAVAFTATTTTHALEQSDPPLIRDSGGMGSSPGVGDPSLGGTRMPPGGDKERVDAAERAEKAAERKAKAAEQKKQEERRRQEAADAAATSKNNDRRSALSPPALTLQRANAASPVAHVASAPGLTSTPAANRRSALAPSALSR